VTFVNILYWNMADLFVVYCFVGIVVRNMVSVKDSVRTRVGVRVRF